MIRIHLVLVVLACLSGSAPAQEAERVDAAALAAAAGAIAPSDQWFGMFAGWVNVGRMHLVVESAADGGWRIVADSEASAPARPDSTGRVVVDVGPDFAFRSAEWTVTEGVVSKVTSRCRRTGPGAGRFEAEGMMRGRPVSRSADLDLPAEAVLREALLVLAPRLDWSDGKRREFAILELNGTVRTDAGVAEGPLVRLDGFGALSIEGGRVVAVDSPGGSRMLERAEAESRVDLPIPRETPEDLVRAAVLDFVRATITSDAVLLESAVDLEACRKSEGEADPAVLAMTPEAYAARFRERMAPARTPTPDQLQYILRGVALGMRVERKGATAKVTVAVGHGATVHDLAETEGRWRLVRIPK